MATDNNIQWTNTTRVMNEFAQAVVDSYKDKLQSAGYANGDLYKTLTFNVRMLKSGYRVTLKLAEYWKYIEYGRRPGAKMPPIKAIQDWIEAKAIVPRPMTLPNGKQEIPSTASLAYVIARSISRKGIKARPFLSQSLEGVQSEFIERMKAAIAQDIADSVHDAVQESR